MTEDLPLPPWAIEVAERLIREQLGPDKRIDIDALKMALTKALDAAYENGLEEGLWIGKA
jgi:hypothetical protein